MVWQFELAPEIVTQINNGSYQLFVQKQIGTLANKLTLDLNFGKNIVSADPAEAPTNFGDSHYSYQTDLTVDRDFTIGLSN